MGCFQAGVFARERWHSFLTEMQGRKDRLNSPEHSTIPYHPSLLSDKSSNTVYSGSHVVVTKAVHCQQIFSIYSTTISFLI